MHLRTVHAKRNDLVVTPEDRVYVELDWFDGPLKGVADVIGYPHYFERQFNHALDDWNHQSFLVWTITKNDLQLEIESWQIFVEWNERYESGTASPSSHPGQPNEHPRFAELENLLQEGRSAPVSGRILRPRWIDLDRAHRYSADGPDYKVRWFD